MAVFVPLFGIVGEEDDLAASGTWAGGQTARELFGFGHGVFVEDGVE